MSVHHLDFGNTFITKIVKKPKTNKIQINSVHNIHMCLSYVQVKFECIWPFHYGDLAFELTSVKLTMSGVKRVKQFFYIFFMHIHPFCDVQLTLCYNLNKNRFQESASPHVTMSFVAVPSVRPSFVRACGTSLVR